KLKTDIIGVSKDSIESHNSFKRKYKFPFELLSDEKIKLIKALGAWGEKSMYGKKFMGIKRTTVLIDKKRVVKKIWNNVKVKDHIKNVLKFIKDLN
ncbi:MAG: redoxin domain-containing protein, partial [Pelagibacteraceae bacterium]